MPALSILTTAANRQFHIQLSLHVPPISISCSQDLNIRGHEPQAEILLTSAFLIIFFLYSHHVYHVMVFRLAAPTSEISLAGGMPSE